MSIAARLFDIKQRATRRTVTEADIDFMLGIVERYLFVMRLFGAGARLRFDDSKLDDTWAIDAIRGDMLYETE